MKIRRIDHVAFAVNDASRFTSMFSSLFGIEVHSTETRNNTEITILSIDDTHLEFLSSSDPATRTGQFLSRSGPGYFHLCLEVDDLDEAIGELRSKGVKFLTEVPITGQAGSRVTFIDPSSAEGMLIELAQINYGSSSS